ncbi:monocarboxylate transporter 13-like [Ahaetulla prasina]|uniref:monocarboxylate transporter 13-like n=1 Tax=Ahaetulla prasina TaxID=499056 RepID=UPI002649F377|nr:monocarboxylate transporter 13-like [Ahaetulla prasina]
MRSPAGWDCWSRHYEVRQMSGSISAGRKEPPPPPSSAAVAAVPDGGWGWMVVLGGFVQSALVFGVIRSFGVFFVEFVAHFGESSGSVSWVVSLGIAVLQFASPLGSTLSARYGARPVVMAGGFLSSVGLFLASFSTSLVHLHLTIGLLTGLGWALVFTPSVAAVSHYFEKRRTLAMGLAVSGAGISSLAFCPFFQYLVDLYGWRGALQIVAAMSLNLVASGAVLRPLAVEDEPTTLASSFALELLHHGPFLRYVLVFVLVDMGYFVPYVHLVAYARDVGCGEYDTASIMSVAAVADMVGRIFAGWLADARVFSRSVHDLTLWMALTGICLALVPLGHSLETLMPIGLCYGFFAGALVPLQFTSLVEIVGARYVMAGIGYMHMLESTGALVGTPISGWLRDMTGTFTASFVCAGVVLLAASLVLLTLPEYFSCSRAPKAHLPGPAEPHGPKSLESRGGPQQGRDLSWIEIG